MKKNINLIEKYIEFIFAQKNLAKNTIMSYENDLYLVKVYFLR